MLQLVSASPVTHSPPCTLHDVPCRGHLLIVEKLVLVFGPMRELVLDGAPELSGKVVAALTDLVQIKQISPVPYRPALLGLVERFHRSWKDMVSIYVAEAQNDWDCWLPCAVYAYNGARHSATGFSPNELMMGRRLRTPNELLRTAGVTQVGEFAEYHRKLVRQMAQCAAAAKTALVKDQLQREKFYNRRERHTTEFDVGDLVWVLRPPRGKGITKLSHQWVGPALITEDAGFDSSMHIVSCIFNFTQMTTLDAIHRSMLFVLLRCP
ncbi:hypothetical protein PR003_g19323 [Phytophthora rubi]|uniref:Integrase catalytic domain-containing protein n=1 Tax=Phytophthora rubi TaxID=129364 RepID=A0A6A4DWN5_9STRA|nr:hypothetical protein PR003_g19323 [Phytophthora rubi]